MSSPETTFDLIIIGAGPGGYVTAERAGARGKKVLLVEQADLGGVCLNAGCIPTKTLLNAAKVYHTAGHGERFGVTTGSVTFDLAAAMAWKETVIANLRKGIAAGLKHHGVTVVTGSGVLEAGPAVRVGDQRYEAEKVIIATGSSSAMPPIPGIDSPQVVTSTQILSITDQPQRLVIIGGGYIGMEFAAFFSTIGTEVVVVEMADEIIPFVDPELTKLLRTSLRSVRFELGCRVTGIAGNRVTFTKGGGAESTVEGDLILVSVGRKPNLAGITAERLEVTKTGIVVDEFMRTNLPGVYAVGDVTGKSLLAHSASRMGEVALNHMFGTLDHTGAAAGYQDRMRYHAIPWVVFTTPEIAGCGMTEAEATAAGIPATTKKLSMKFSGRYLAEHPEERGVAKMVVRTDTGAIVGAHLFGTGVSEQIHSVALMIEHGLRVTDITETVFPHPTVSEVMRESLFQ